MTETTADDIRQMAPDALRRWLAEHTGWTFTCGAWDDLMSGYQWDFEGPGQIYGMHWFNTQDLDGFWAALRYWEQFSDEGEIPDWPHSLAAAWTLVLEHCAHDSGANIEIWTRPDGSVLVFNARANVLSSLAKMETYKVTNYPGLSGPVALADALARMVGLALLERG